MSFWQKMKMNLIHFMEGRNGADHLGMFTLLSGLILSLFSSVFGLPVLTFLGLALYLLTLYRMFSRKLEARMKENQKYLEITGKYRTKTRQFFLRMRNRKQYKYFRCPKCRVLLRMKRGSGQKTITCARCGHQFDKKS